MLLNSPISAYTRCLAEKVCGLVRSTWGTSQGEDKLGARDGMLNTKPARRACAGARRANIPPLYREHLSPSGLVHWRDRERHLEQKTIRSFGMTS